MPLPDVLTIAGYCLRTEAGSLSDPEFTGYELRRLFRISVGVSQGDLSRGPSTTPPLRLLRRPTAARPVAVAEAHLL